MDDYNIITTIDKYVKETFIEDDIPIKAFNLKTNKLYVYSDKEQLLQQQELKPFIDIISKQFPEQYYQNGIIVMKQKCLMIVCQQNI